MYEPDFTITNSILKNVGVVEAARELVVNAPLVPTYMMRFRKEAMLRTIHYGTHIEGNELNLGEVRKVLEGREVTARQRDVQEVINYRRVVRLLEEILATTKEAAKGGEGEAEVSYTQKMIKKIHSLVCDRVIPEEKVGTYRKTQVVLREAKTGEVFFRPPVAVEVPYLMEEFVDWLNSKKGRDWHPILRAGVAHYVLAAVHPFVEGNGRTARAFATLVLFAEGYDIRKFFSLEEYFDQNPGDYYQALFDTSSQNEDLAKRDLTPWLEYFTLAMAKELERVKERVKRLSLDVKMKVKIGDQVPLNERQIKLMEYLEENEVVTIRQAKEVVSDYSEDTLLRDIKYFIKKGLVKKKGRTKAARYVLQKK